jgi:mannose-6-phosphate isomerase-like protein (cupin superfamily)
VTSIEERPWGRFEILYEEPNLKIKRIVVRQGKRLSLQSHEKRSESWVILRGKAVVTLGNGRAHISSNQSIFIPARERHRVESVGEEDLVFIEVQTGSYLGEDDIRRYEDDFNRL